MPTKSALPYDPWSDANEDGKIDMKDIGNIAAQFMTSGDPTKNVNVTNFPLDSQGSLNVTVANSERPAWHNATYACDIVNFNPGEFSSGSSPYVFSGGVAVDSVAFDFMPLSGNFTIHRLLIDGVFGGRTSQATGVYFEDIEVNGLPIQMGSSAPLFVPNYFFCDTDNSTILDSLTTTCFNELRFVNQNNSPLFWKITVHLYYTYFGY